MNEKITAQPPKEERQEVLKEIRQLENRKKILENKQRNEERRVRTRRLIELIALGIKLSIDNGFAGDVILEAKTTALAKHYEKDFGAILLPTFQSSAPRYLIADDAAKQIFLTYLSE